MQTIAQSIITMALMTVVSASNNRGNSVNIFSNGIRRVMYFCGFSSPFLMFFITYSKSALVAFLLLISVVSRL